MEDENIEYGDRYCAYLDILGFRELVNGLSANLENVMSLRRVLQKVHAPMGGGVLLTIRSQSISDAVALSTDLTMCALQNLLDGISYLTLDLLLEGYFVRGAVVRGPLYHDDRMVFGQALVDAFHYESEIARYPRVIVVQRVRDDILRADPQLIRTILKQADDGPMYIDVLRTVRAVGKAAKNPTVKLDPWQQDLHTKFQSIGGILQNKFADSMDNPRHFEKVQWFARYWNETIDNARLEYRKVLGAGLDTGTPRGPNKR
jgi:hypothetical protein